MGLGWVDFDCVFKTHLAQPLLPNSYQPRQNWADSGTPKIQVNPTQVLGQMNHPVGFVIKAIAFTFTKN